MISTSNQTTILDELHKIDPRLFRATDLFGDGWWRVNALRRLFSRSPPLSHVGALAWFSPAVIIVLIWGATPEYSGYIVASLWLIVGPLVLLLGNSLMRGMASVHRFRDALGTLLQQKMFPESPGRVVRMSDFGQDGRPEGAGRLPQGRSGGCHDLVPFEQCALILGLTISARVENLQFNRREPPIAA